ncbi:MAG TPA: crosslink repair DNA glycosylase YcaQ family protein, partial [Ktedonobacterales bacterium]|nr:crosslink repair DNA glycosylase YcaQ family protein [Ktedonobacterales bacterium]
QVIAETLDAIRTRGPLASADFETPPAAKRASPWDWYGPKESRIALDVLWMMGNLMIHSRRGGQKLYDLRERVLAEAFREAIPSDDALPSGAEALRYFTLRTIRALGVVAPAWLWDYFRLGQRYHQISLDGEAHPKRLGRVASAQATLDRLAREGAVIPAAVEGISGPVYVAPERLPDLERVRAGQPPTRTTLLSPFDNLIWDRARARTLFGYEVCFEAYVVPAKRRYGYYCLAILHQGRLVGRLDPKMNRQQRRLIVRALYLEPDVTPDDTLLTRLADALHELARWLGAHTIAIERSEPEALAARLGKLL